MKTLIGIKKGMTQVFVDNKSIPVTIVDMSSTRVANIRDSKAELATGASKSKPTKAQQGQYKDLGEVPMHTVWVDMSEGEEVKIGDGDLHKDVEAGTVANVTAKSKGKGFAGVVKRWGFAGGPKTHGQSDRHRAPGSIGAGTDPGRVFKGKKMPGRMGGDTVTLKNKKIVEIKGDYLLISGALPGANGSPVTIQLRA